MRFFTLALISALATTVFAAPGVVEKRQGDKTLPPGPPGRPTKTTTTKKTTSTTKYTPTSTTKKTSRKPTTTTTGEETGPSSTRCPVPLYYKCGGWDNGKPWAGCTECVEGAVCVVQNEWYSQCVAEED